jgi:hypothetical protein
MKYSEKAGKCSKYEMQGEQQECVKWAVSNQGQCLEEKIVNNCVKYVPGGQTCIKKSTVTSCVKESSRRECTKYGEREVCVSNQNTASRTCSRYESRIVGCAQEKQITKCVAYSQQTSPHTTCQTVKFCTKQLPPTQVKYCTAYKKVCQKAKREICTTTTCPCSKKPVKQCRTVYVDASTEQKCSSFATRTVPGKCASYGSKQVCKSAPSNSNTGKVCTQYKTFKECVKPSTEKICTKWETNSGSTCTKKEKVKVCLASKTVKFCAQTVQKEICQNYAVTNPRCAEFASQTVCLKRSAGQRVCEKYVGFGGKQTCVETAKESVCAETKEICTYE